MRLGNYWAILPEVNFIRDGEGGGGLEREQSQGLKFGDQPVTHRQKMSQNTE